jgi:hypothetical protein
LKLAGGGGRDEAEVERAPLGWSSNKVVNYFVFSLASAYVDRNADPTSQNANGLGVAAKDVDMFSHFTSYDRKS